MFSLPSFVHLLVMLVGHKEEGHFQVCWRVLAHSFSACLWDPASLWPPTHSLYQSWLWQATRKQPQPLSSGVSVATSCQGSRAPGGAPRLPCVCPSLSFSSFLHLSTGYEKAFCPSFFPYASPTELQAHPGLHSHLPGRQHPVGPLESFQPMDKLLFPVPLTTG